MKRGWKSILGALLIAALPTAAAAKVVLYEDFSSGAVPSSFQVYGPAGAVSVVDVGGNLALKVDGTASLSVGNPTWTDYSVQARVYLYENSYWMYSAGLFVRGQGDLSSSYSSNAISWSVRPGFMEAQKWTVGPGWSVVVTDPAHSFPAGEWHTLKVAAKGAHFDFFLDGALVDSYDDAAASAAGVVGLGNWICGAFYDDLLVDVAEQPGVLRSEDFAYGSSALHSLWTVQGQGGGAVSARVIPFQGRNVLELYGTGVASIGDRAWTDYTTETDLYVFDPSYGAYATGPFVRAQDLGWDWWWSTAYVWQARPGDLELERWNGNLQANGDIVYLLTAPPTTPYAWHRLKVVASGPQLKLFLDDAPVGTVADTSSLSGKVGLRAYAVGTYFANFVVRANDTTPPVTTASVTAAGKAGWTVAPATVSLRAADAPTPAASGVREVRFALDGAAETVVPGSAADVALADGRHTVAYRAIDKDDNAEVSRTLTVAVDATPPQVQVATAPASIKANGKAQAVRITGSVADATSGVASYAIAVTNLAGKVVATARSFGSTVSLVGQKCQKYTVTVVAFDKAGNRATAAAVVTVN